MHFITNGFNAFHRPTRPIQVNVSLYYGSTMLDRCFNEPIFHCFVLIMEGFHCTSARLFVKSNFYPIKWPTMLVLKVKGKPRSSEACSCGSFQLLFQIHNGFKRFPWTNSTDPRQSSPLKKKGVISETFGSFPPFYGSLFDPQLDKSLCF